MSQTVTSPAGEQIELLERSELHALLDRGPGTAFSLMMRLDDGRSAIVRDLWTNGPAEDRKSGRATEALTKRLGLQNEARYLTPQLKGGALGVGVHREVKGKRCYFIGLRAMPKEWFEQLHLNGVSEASVPAEAPVVAAEPLEVEAAPSELPPELPPAVEAAELQVAGAVATALLTQVVEIIVAGNGGSSMMTRLKADLEQVQQRLGQQTDYSTRLRRDLRQAQDDIAALTVERDGLRQRLRAAEHNLKVATSAETAKLIDQEVHRQVDRLMRTVPGDVHARQS